MADVLSTKELVIFYVDNQQRVAVGDCVDGPFLVVLKVKSQRKDEFCSWWKRRNTIVSSPVEGNLERKNREKKRCEGGVPLLHVCCIETEPPGHLLCPP